MIKISHEKFGRDDSGAYSTKSKLSQQTNIIIS